MGRSEVWPPGTLKFSVVGSVEKIIWSPKRIGLAEIVEANMAHNKTVFLTLILTFHLELEEVKKPIKAFVYHKLRTADLEHFFSKIFEKLADHFLGLTLHCGRSFWMDIVAPMTSSDPFFWKAKSSTIFSFPKSLYTFLVPE